MFFLNDEHVDKVLIVQHLPVLMAHVVGCLLQEQEVTGSILGCAIPKVLIVVTLATMLGARHYKASTTNTK